jgi:hypothetical protein
LEVHVVEGPDAAAITTIPVLFVTFKTAEQLRNAPPEALLRWPTTEVKQQLITVEPTYLLTQTDAAANDSGCTGKMVSRPAALSYGGRTDFGRGHGDITHAPVLTMEQEFLRNGTWRDWKENQHSAADEWAYATGAAREGGPDGSDAKRDIDNGGKTAGDFMAAANLHIQRKLQKQQGETFGKSPQALLLVLEEAVAIRLYSGPAYYPINAFLRELSKLSADWRSKLARDPKTTYSATVGWLISGIRKLARVTELGTLYRGVRGALPDAFSLRDMQGMISATDFGFMSTSRSKAICVNFMSKTQPNVLWELACRDEDEAYHNGADISLLSQFPGEQEVLFPPLTMMVAATPQEQLVMVDKIHADSGVQFQQIAVVPYYV